MTTTLLSSSSPSRRLLLLATALLLSSSPGPVLGQSTGAALTPVPIRQVTVDDAFWSPKIQLWRQTTINDVFGKFEQYGGFANFDRVAAGQTGGHQGDPWCDGLIYETIRAAADFLAAQDDPALLARVRGYIARISAAAARDPDGYLNTAQQLDGIGIKWTNPPQPGDPHDDNFPHTIYNAGCLMEAATHFYKATGDTGLLKVATRLANYMSGIMGPAPKLNIIPGHAVGEESFVDLYRLYRDEPELKDKVGLPVTEQDYLNLAQFWIEARGHTAGRTSAGAYNQDDVSVFQQPALEGHAVRSALLATGIAAAAVENGRADYRETVTRWWRNMVDARMYLTGGLGAVADNEGFGADYQLPNNGYAETCAAAAGGFFSYNMSLLTGEAQYVDVLERELYNGALGCVSQEGNTYFYTNPLTSGPEHRRWQWAGPGLGLTPCCPPMFLKLQSALPGFIYATDADGVYVNLFIGSHAEVHRGALNVSLTQTTAYPWDGLVEVAVDPATAGPEFTVNLRIPGWAKNPQIAVNGQTLQGVTVTSGYAKIRRAWRTGDRVSLRLPMPVEKIKADARVAANVGRTALMRGPLVYCFEGLDNDPSTRAILLENGDVFQPVCQPGLLGGVVQLEGLASVLKGGAGSARREPATVRAIPFYTYQNRAATSADVWVADAADAAQASPGGTPAVSYCNPTDTALAMNDNILPKSSDDDSIPRMTWWSHKGTAEWAQITYAEPQDIASVDAYWWDERRVSRDCRVPQSWSVQYLDGGVWKAVAGASAYGTDIDRFNHVTFTPVRTTGIRIVAQLQSGWSGGILEMTVGAPAVVPSASLTFAGDTVTAMTDGRIPASSDDESIPRQTYWNHTGTREWAQLTYSAPRTFSALDVYWWDERRLARDCRVPQSWSLQYLDGGVWKPVTGASTYGTEMDRFNRVQFDPVMTTALRLDIQLQPGWSAGILEMRAWEPGTAAPLTGWLTDHGYPAGTGVTAPLLTAYALGLEPGASLPGPQRSATGVALSFWGGRTDVLYSAEWSTDLRNWSPWGVSLSQPDQAGMRSVILPAGAAPAFMRLKLAAPDPQ